MKKIYTKKKGIFTREEMSRTIEIVYADGSVGTMTIVKRQKKVKKTYRLIDDVWEHVKDYLGCKIQVDWDKVRYLIHSYKKSHLGSLTWTMKRVYMMNEYELPPHYSYTTYIEGHKEYTEGKKSGYFIQYVRFDGSLSENLGCMIDPPAPSSVEARMSRLEFLRKLQA